MTARLIATRLVRPAEPHAVIYEVMMHEDLPVGWPPELVRDLAGPFVMEQRVLPDGLWVKVASADDGFRSLAWETPLSPVRYDLEWLE